ncbi:MAG: hypothetical protein F6J93_40430 [Oscillatoria sp. SIO1A7]|nr:hypothetical protein [Oscillatoria sp. SIO1A7]
MGTGGIGQGDLEARRPGDLGGDLRTIFSSPFPHFVGVAAPKGLGGFPHLDGGFPHLDGGFPHLDGGFPHLPPFPLPRSPSPPVSLSPSPPVSLSPCSPAPCPIPDRFARMEL